MRTSTSNPTLSLRGLLETTSASFTVVRHWPGEVIFYQGDDADTVMHIEEGRVRLSVSGASGKGAIFGLMGPGSFLGEDVLGGRSRRRQTATALIETELLVLKKTEMTRLIRADEAISERFITHTLARKASLETDLTVQLLCSGEDRLIHTLLTLAGCDSRCNGRYALPKVSQEVIAEMVGTTRSRVNFFMGKFKKHGFLEKQGDLLQVIPSNLAFLRADSRAL
ncbi:MAG: Crp/Fnr family transcriptional regulator [Acidobacteria bacterium]|jgi:CRP-like cAMP-binding protein|nr:Crp/Fnr family transcriptional regulator [Acidobacteriota bacterium]